MLVHKYNLRSLKRFAPYLKNKKKSSVVRRYNLRSYQKRYDDVDLKNWVNASSTRNFAFNDNLADWLNEYGRAKGLVPIYDTGTRYNESANFTNYIMDKGNEFEKVVINTIRERFGDDVVTVCDTYNSANLEKYKETLELMKKGVPIIYQGPIRNYDNRSYGTPDLIVRSDYINRLVNTTILSKEEENISSPLLGINYHYRIIDIKFSSFKLCADGLTLRKMANVDAYSLQSAIYNLALGIIQGYYPDTSYLLGRGYSNDCKNGFKNNNSFDRLAQISYTTNDVYERTREAIEWLRDVKENGNKWDIYDKNGKISKPDFYPNMSNKLDDKAWHNIKKKIATDCGEITTIYQCGIKQRKRAHSQGVYSYKDRRCTPKVLGFKDDKSKIYKRVKSILDVNKSKTKMFLPEKIENNDREWQKEQELEFFIDFEALNNMNDTFQSFPEKGGNAMIYLIGCGYSYKGEWYFKNFSLNRLKVEQEEYIIDQFINFMDDIKKQYKCENKDILIHHWSHAEINMIKQANARHSKNWNIQGNFDMCKLFMNEAIGVKNSLNYGLKNIARAMYNNGMIETSWSTGEFSDGGKLIPSIINLDRKLEGTYITLPNCLEYKYIQEYNETDCKVMWEIINYIRKNHV